MTRPRNDPKRLTTLHPGGFGYVPTAALRDPRLTPVHRAVFAAVTSALDFGRQAGSVRLRRISERAGVSRATARTAVRDLERFGYWTISQDPGRSQTFTLKTPEVRENAEDAEDVEPRRGPDGRFLPREDDRPLMSQPTRTVGPKGSGEMDGTHAVGRKGRGLAHGMTPQNFLPEPIPEEDPERDRAVARLVRHEGISHLEALAIVDGLAATGPSDLKPRARDPLFDALVEACGMDPAEVSGSEARSVGVAAAEIRRKGATPEDVIRRAARWDEIFPRASKTPHAIAKHWARLNGAAPAGEAPRGGRTARGLMNEAKRWPTTEDGER